MPERHCEKVDSIPKGLNLLSHLEIDLKKSIPLSSKESQPHLSLKAGMF